MYKQDPEKEKEVNSDYVWGVSCMFVTFFVAGPRVGNMNAPLTHDRELQFEKHSNKSL